MNRSLKVFFLMVAMGATVSSFGAAEGNLPYLVFKVVLGKPFGLNMPPKLSQFREAIADPEYGAGISPHLQEIIVEGKAVELTDANYKEEITSWPYRGACVHVRQKR